ncbi:30S ribosomal protein S15 [Striga asiatica]|uniref:30S ribosomal protein S15 n=1 Tax=Striga asiatica TaxID=4170 RepID=A0A5A7PWZ7_STRAF|nr:30S ribosomal protein S15 [Striga asiatica]
MREVFDIRRGHKCGFGRILKGSKSSAIYDIPESSITSNSTIKDTQSTEGDARCFVFKILFGHLFEKMSMALARLKARVVLMLMKSRRRMLNSLIKRMRTSNVNVSLIL